MALKLPGAEDLGAPASGRSGRPIATFDTTAIGRGMANAGMGARQLGAGLAVRDKKIRQEVDRQSEFDTQTRFLRFEDQQRKTFADAVLKAPVGADGFTASQVQGYRKAADEFFETVPDALKPAYRSQLFRLESTISSKADEFSVAEKDRVAKTKIADGQNVILQGLQDNPAGWREADAQAEKLVRTSGRTAVDQDIDLREWRQRRAEALWKIDSTANGAAARKRLGINAPVAEGIPPEGAALLNTIAGTESGGRYDIINGGAKFSDFSRHPKEGQRGSAGIAAGKYQFLPSTWDRTSRALGLTDFSPGNQDKGAWWLAQTDYRAKTGRDLLTDLKSPDANVKAGIRRALSSTWEGLRSMGDGRFVAAVSGASSELAPEYADLSFEDRSKLFDRSIADEEKAQTEASVQYKAQRAAFKDALSLDIERGKVVSQQDILGADLDDGDKVTLLKALNAKLKEDGGVSDLTSRILSGSPDAAINPFDEDQRKLADKAFDAMQKAVPDDQKNVVTDSFVQATGYIPQPVQAQIRQGAMSTNPAIFAGAMSQADTLQATAPVSFEAFSGGTDVRDKLADFRHFVNDLGMSGESAASEVLKRQDQAVKVNRDVLKPEADKFLKTLSLSQVTDAFDPGVFASEPGAGIMPEQSSALLAEYKEIAEDAFFATNGDAGMAKSRALAELKTRWDVSNVSGSPNLMRLPPEKYYPPVPGGDAGPYGYLRDDALATAQKYADQHGQKVENVAIMANDKTRADIEMHRPPRYRLFYLHTENGQKYFDEVPGSWGVDGATVRKHQDASNEAARDRFKRDLLKDDALNEIGRKAEERAQKVYDDTVGANWMKARAAEAERERGRIEADGLRLQQEAKPEPEESEDDKRMRRLGTSLYSGAQGHF